MFARRKNCPDNLSVIIHRIRLNPRVYTATLSLDEGKVQTEPNMCTLQQTDFISSVIMYTSRSCCFLVAAI
jgi:hypothetical protein